MGLPRATGESLPRGTGEGLLTLEIGEDFFNPRDLPTCGMGFLGPTGLPTRRTGEGLPTREIGPR